MALLLSLWYLFVLSFLNLTSAFPNTPEHDTTDTRSAEHSEVEIIERDVAIVGGGSSGTYSAIRLQKLGHSVALIEKEDRLGGHVNTYVDPAGRATFDYGVIILVNISLVRDYFSYLDVPLGEYTGFGTGGTEFVDFAEGKAVPAPDNSDAEAVAVAKYAQLLSEEYSYLASGFHLPDPVPEELLMPYGDFLAERNLSDLAYTAWYIDEGVGNPLAQPALYMMKYYNLLQVEGINYGFVNANNNYQGLYNAALAKLNPPSSPTNPSAYLSSTITHISRTYPSNITITYTTPSGPKLLHAKTLLLTIPPLPSLLSPFLALTPTEEILFSKFNTTYIWDAILTNTGIPPGVAVQNLDPEAPEGIPASPADYAFVPAPWDGVHATWYGSDRYMSDEDVKSSILETLSRIRTAKNYSLPEGTQPEFVEFHNHNPYELTVCPEAIRDGFYEKVNSLQGVMGTFWTGAAWESHDSTAIWNFTEYEILPRIVADLKEKKER